MLELVTLVNQDRPGTTKQAVYAALRGLKKTEAIVTYKGVASLNLTWIYGRINFFALARQNYAKGEASEGSFIDLADREKIQYFFKSAVKADIFWTHALYLLLERSQPGEPVYLYNPHEWFLLARYDNESKFFRTINRQGHRVLLTAGADTYLDQYVRQYFDNDLSQYHMRDQPLFKDSNYYLNVLGDFLIEVWLDKKMIAKVEQCYQETKSWDAAAKQRLNAIVNIEGRMKLVISRNHAKAERIKKMLRRNFILKSR